MSALEQWNAAGRPWTKAQPIADVGGCLEHYGFTVYYLGNEEHLEHDPPEDHCPFSATGWPGKSPHWWVFACDVMPPPSDKNLPSLAELGAQLFADKQAGFGGATWIKYMNWTDADGNCWHDSWQPNHERESSSDTGHIHISGRTDFRTRRTAADYDPIARALGDDMALKDDPDGLALVRRVRGIETLAATVDVGPAGHPKMEPLPLTAAILDIKAALADLAAAVAALTPTPVPGPTDVQVTGTLTLAPPT